MIKDIKSAFTEKCIRKYFILFYFILFYFILFYLFHARREEVEVK